VKPRTRSHACRYDRGGCFSFSGPIASTHRQMMARSSFWRKEGAEYLRFVRNRLVSPGATRCPKSRPIEGKVRPRSRAVRELEARDVDLDGCDFRAGYLSLGAEGRDSCVLLHGRCTQWRAIVSRSLSSLPRPRLAATNDTKRNAVRQRARARPRQ